MKQEVAAEKLHSEANDDRTNEYNKLTNGGYCPQQKSGEHCVA